jgi:serine/threonine protein kinase
MLECAVVASPQHQTIGRYEILGSLARGGMAELFLARLVGVEGFAKQVVIKRVLPELAGERAFVELFVAEARLAATLDHQNIVHVHDIGHDASGYFFAMELLHGADLGSILGMVTRFGGELPLAIAIEIARAACAGLHYAHERKAATGEPLGLVHRDVSPSNLFVTFDGAVKLLDFGIAKAAQSAAHTRTGALRGKVPYMSPEQCNAAPLDRRSDVFSLSVVLWEMTVGARLYGGSGESDLATMKAIVDHDARRPSDHRPGYPAELERIVLRGLARDREARYPTIDELQVELEAFARTAAAWTSAREMARFMAEVFPDRADVWQEHARRGTVSLLVPGRQTAPLPPSLTGSASAPVIVPGPPPVSAPVATPASVAAPAPAEAPAPAAARPRTMLIAAALGAAAIAAIAIGFAWGAARSSSVATPAASTPATPTAPRGAVTEDAMWFQSDDYLIHETAYRGARLNGLWVAKSLTPAPRPGAPASFLDANGTEHTTEHYWRTRMARPADLTIGALAFCRTNGAEGKKPNDRAEARTEPWMLGRVTEVSRLDAGEVSIANAVCELGAVRVAIDP